MNYAEIDKDGYVIGLYTLSDVVSCDNYIFIGDESIEFGRKYDRINKIWTDEFRPQLPEGPILATISEHEQLTKSMSENVETSSFDNLINMDMLLGLDEKLNAIMKHLGI